MANSVGYSTMTKNVTYPFPRPAALRPQQPPNDAPGAPPVTALSVEFVAKPQESYRVEATIPTAITGALKDVTGFAGCLVMISDQEARLVTVVTLWAGDDRVKRCSQNVRWLHALLAPYLDRRLRVQTMVAYIPALPRILSEKNAAGESSMTPDLLSEDETVCVA